MFAYDLGDGARLALLEPWHADQFLAALDRSRQHLLAEVRAANLVHTLDESRETLQGWADARAADTRHLLGIWIDGQLDGCVQVFDFDANMRTCELGVWIAAHAQGRGLVTRACRVVIDWAITQRGILRVQWANTPTNRRSAMVAQRLGMTREGVLRSAWEVGGIRHDSEVWSLLASDYQGMGTHSRSSEA